MIVEVPTTGTGWVVFDTMIVGSSISVVFGGKNFFLDSSSLK